MATKFLQRHLETLHRKLGGDKTVSYITYDESAKDSLTGDVNESAAYAATPVYLPALIDFSPSEAMRQKLGLELDFDATLSLTTEQLDEKGISLKIGDAFILPGETGKSYVTKIVPTHQAGSVFLMRLVAVSRKVGRR